MTPLTKPVIRSCEIMLDYRTRGRERDQYAVRLDIGGVSFRPKRTRKWITLTMAEALKTALLVEADRAKAERKKRRTK